jgi:branched-subunit amino acid aminotransferase/4-amino-4-deoxychorismate lyase
MQMLQYIAVNGELLPEDAVCISPKDRGFRYGDGAFETIRIMRGTPYQWLFHQKRLAKSLADLRIDYDVRQLKPLAKMLLEKNQLDEGFLRIQITRGVGSQGYRPQKTTACYVMETAPKLALDESVCQLFSSSYQRPPAAYLPGGGKFTHGITSTLALLEAADHACEDALMLSHKGNISETANANIFWLKNEILYTPALENDCLNGSIRHFLIKNAPYEVKQASQKPGALHKAEAIFSCNVRSLLRPCSLHKKPLHYDNYAWDAFESLRGFILDDIARHCLDHKNTW